MANHFRNISINQWCMANGSTVSNFVDQLPCSPTSRSSEWWAVPHPAQRKSWLVGGNHHWSPRGKPSRSRAVHHHPVVDLISRQFISRSGVTASSTSAFPRGVKLHHDLRSSQLTTPPKNPCCKPSMFTTDEETP